MDNKYSAWQIIELKAWFHKGNGYGSDMRYTVEELYQMFAQRLACEAAERTLDMLKAGL